MIKRKIFMGTAIFVLAATNAYSQIQAPVAAVQSVTSTVKGQQALAAAGQLLANAKAAIAAAASKPTLKEKIDFLVGQAQGFLNAKNYQDAFNVANYVMSKLDKNSPQAKSIMDQAKAHLAKAAQGSMGNLMNKFGGLAK